MKAPYKKDKLHRLAFLKQEEKVLCLKTLKKNTILKSQWWARHKLDTFRLSTYKNRCLITHRGRSTNQDFKLSRLEFRRWALASKLPGLTKGSW
jgi:ribosomal protein S14